MAEPESHALWWRSPELPPEPESVGAAREFVVGCCERWGLVDVSETAVLLVSELATNAVRHARTPVTIWLARRLDRIVLSVQDGSPVHSHVEHPDTLDEHGRGMLLVDVLAERWGEREVPDGKMVWAEIATR